jgi:transposase
MAIMPKAFPPELREEVVLVARRREQSLARTAKDFGISESCLHRWLALDEIETGDRPGTARAEAAENRELKKRNKILEEE